MNDQIKYYPLTHPQKGIWYTEKLHPHTSFGNIAGTVRIKGDIDYLLMEKAINYVLETNDSIYMDSYKARWHFNGHQTNSLTIHINERDGDGNLVLDYDFLKAVFAVKEMEYLQKHLLVLIQDAMKNPDKKINQLDIIEEEEKNRIMYSFNTAFVNGYEGCSCK